MKLFIAVLPHNDNVPLVYIAKEILFCQCATKENIYLRFLGLIVVSVKFVFSISQFKILLYRQWRLLFCFVFCMPKAASVFLVFQNLKILAKATHKQ